MRDHKTHIHERPARVVCRTQLQALGVAARGAAIVVLMVATAHAGPNGNLKRGTLASGAGNGTSTSHRLRGTVGQAVAGRTGAPRTNGASIGFWYVIRQGGIVGVEPGPSRNPVAFRLHQNAPNPFRDVTRVLFALPREVDVKLRVFDVTGRVLATPIDQSMNAGEYTFVFEPRGLASGTYFYELRAGSFVERKRFVLLK